MSLNYQKNKSEEEIEITGFSGRVTDLKIPDRIEGIPVTVIADHAFAGRKDLKRVMLPKGIHTLGAFAFYSCPNLETITLCDKIEDYYDGVIKNCRNLSEITVELYRNHYDLVRRLLSDNDRRLRFLLHWHAEDGGVKETARLTFPEYVYEYQEDTRARAFHSRIEGGGYRYRECISRSGVDFKTYDTYFYWATVDDTMTAAEIALGRLLYPMALSDEAGEQYEEFLRKHALKIMNILIRNGKGEEFSYMLEHELLPEDSISEVIRTASRERQPQFCGMLMDYQRKHTEKTAGNNAFSLEDW